MPYAVLYQVMLTALVERGRVKCHQYWPHLYETADFGTLQLTCLKEKETRSFAFRYHKPNITSSCSMYHNSLPVSPPTVYSLSQIA